VDERGVPPLRHQASASEEEMNMIDVVEVVRPVLIASGFQEVGPNVFAEPGGDEAAFHTVPSVDYYWMSLVVGDAVVMEGQARTARQILGAMWAYGLIDWSYVEGHI
jgi:hypothetical protein